MPAFKPRHRSLLFGLALLYQAPVGAQLPSGGKVVDGSATIGAPSGNQQVITQTSQRAIIDWLNFSIGSGQGVHFKQPGANAIILNRVTGNTPSDIFGSLSADGQVFLVNPSGVFFHAGSSVDVAGLMATTLDIDKDDFMAGRYTFSRSEGLSAARREVINEGLLKAREGGYIVLAGDYAANRGEGIIQARLGTAALAAGAQMTLDIAGDSLINFAVDEKTVAELSGVENSGALLADGGRAIMTAAVARDLATAAVNNSGLVQAQTAEEREGVIYLSAGEGNALVSGTLDASGKGTGQKGGTIEVVGDKVALVEDAVLDASGATGGGRINVGGSFQGKGSLPNSRTAFVGQDVELKADAQENGNGGEVVIWSDDYTRFYGHASSRGGAQGGDGGQVEVSGKAILDYNGSVNTLAAKGKAGNLLLDPSDIEILNSIDPATADMTGSSPFQDASNNGGVSRMTVGALEAALASGNVTVTTSSNGSSAGNITIDDGGGGGVQWSSGSTLRLQADNHIYIKSNVQGGNGTLWLDAVNGATQSASTNITANSLLLTGGGSWDLAGVGSSNQINSYNDVNNFAADINGGLLRFSSNKSFTVGAVNGVNGIDHTNGNTQLYLDRNNGKLTLAQSLNSGSIYIRAGGGVSQTGGSVTANNLALVGGAASLTRSGNDVNTLAASLNGALAYTDADSLEIGSVFGVNGITTNNNNVTLRTGNASGFDASKQPSSTNPASLTLNQSVNAGSGTISLTVGNGGVYQRRDVASNGNPMPEGSLLANALVLRSNSTSSVTPFVLSNANNLVGTLAASVNGSVSYTGGPLIVGSVDGVTGIRTTANTIVVPAGVDASNRPTPAVYNDNSVSLSVGGNFWINENIDTTTSTGSGSVSLGLGGDFLAMTAPGKRINANTLSVFGDDMVGTFYLRTYTPTLAAGGGKIMVIDNSDYTGELTALGIGAPASNTSVTGNGSTVDVTSSAKPVGDFYLTTGGGLNIIKLLSKGKNLLLRADSLDILLDATTADGARIMLQPYHLNRRVGIHNDNDRDFNAQTNYSADMLLKFTNPTATFYIGTPQNALLQDPDVQLAAKNALTGDIHIGSDGDFNLGYRSLSAQTSGSIVAHSVGPLYNLRLQAPNLTIHGFETFGNQIHLITNHLSLPGTSANYVNANRPDIMIRSMDDNTVWIGNGLSNKPYEPNFLSSTLAKLPDYSTIIISGSTDHPFPNGGSGHGDIHIPWDDGLGVALGNRKLVLSTGNKIYTYTRTPAYTKRDDGGTSGGLWQGCQDLTTCMGSNPNPYPDPDGSGGGSDGDNSGDGDGGSSSNTDPSDCASCPPAPPNDNPYPPDTPDPGTDTPGTGNTGNGDSSAGDGTSDSGDGGGDNGAGTDGGGTGDSGTGDGTGGAGDGDGGSGTGTDGAGDGTGGAGDGNDSGGDGGAGTGGGGAGDGTGDDGAGDGAGGAGDGDGGAGDGADGNGDGTGGAGDGSDGGGDRGAGTGGGGAGDGDGGDGAGDGDAGNGDSGAGDGSGADGAGDGGDGGGDDGAGTGSGGTGDGDAGAGDGDTGNGNGGDGNGDGNTGNGDDGAGDGSGGAGNGDGGDGDGDGGAGTDSGGSGEGDTGAGTGAEGSGDNDDGNSGDGDGEDGGGDAGTTTDSGGSQDGDGSSDSGGADGGDGSGNTDDGNGSGDGKGDDDGDAGSTTDSGSTGENGNDGNDAEGDGDDGSDGGAAPAVTLDCQDVSSERQQEPDATGQRSNRDLIEVKQDGVKMHDPCKQQPASEDQ